MIKVNQVLNTKTGEVRDRTDDSIDDSTTTFKLGMGLTVCTVSELPSNLKICFEATRCAHTFPAPPPTAQAKLSDGKVKNLNRETMGWQQMLFVHWAILHDVRTGDTWLINDECVPAELVNAYGKIDRSELGKYRIWCPKPKYMGKHDIIEMEKNAVQLWKRNEVPLEWVGTGKNFGELVIPANLSVITPLLLKVKGK